MQKKYIHWVIIGILFGLLVSGAAVRVRPVYAQGLGQLINLIKGKAGFDYGNNSGFVFTKETPNYIAYAGDRATAARRSRAFVLRTSTDGRRECC